MNSSRCTWKRGSLGIQQKMYHCRTCGLVGDLGICEACAKNCHQGHSVVEVPGLKIFNCDCGGECGKHSCKCVPNNQQCTTKRIGTNVSEQHVWWCRTCGMPVDEGVCNICAEKCHAGHDLVDKGIWFSFTCACGKGTNSQQCQCKSVTFEKPPSPSAGERARFPYNDTIRAPSPTYRDAVRSPSPTMGERMKSPSPQGSRIPVPVRAILSPANGSKPKTPPKERPHVTFVNLDDY